MFSVGQALHPEASYAKPRVIVRPCAQISFIQSILIVTEQDSGIGTFVSHNMQNLLGFPFGLDGHKTFPSDAASFCQEFR